MLIDVAIPADRNVVQTEEEKKSLCVEIQRMWNIKCKIIPVINRSHRNSNKWLKETFGSCTRETFNRFTTEDSYTWNITHNVKKNAVCNWNLERWRSSLVQEKYKEEKACD
jgi:hypothetical protein